MGIFGNQAGQARYSGELHNLQLTQSVFGTTLPLLSGTRRLALKLLFYGGFYAVKAPNSGGKGLFGKGDGQYNYYADMIGALASGSAGGGCRGILNVWDQQGKLQNQSGSFVYTVPFGGGTVTPMSATGAPAIQQDLGVSKSAAYSVGPFTDYGSGGPKTLTGTQSVAMQKVTGTLAAGQYSFNPVTSSYSFAAADAGVQVTISYSSVYSLYYFQTTQAAEVPTSGPYQVSTTNQTYFWADNGVINVQTNLPLNAGTDYTESAGVYTFSSALAGTLVYINYTYTSSSSAITNTSTLNLTFFGGTLGQTPSSYMQSKYPGAAFGFTGISYVLANPMALGESATTPSYNVELVGLNLFPGGGLDAHPCDHFTMLLYDAFVGCNFPSANVDAWISCYAYWAANGYLGSFLIDTQISVAEAMKEIISVGNVGVFFSGGLLKMVPYGDATVVGNGYTYTPNTTPAAVLTWSNLLPPTEEQAGKTGSEDVLQVEQKAPQDCWNYVQAQWCNRLNDYNNELINEQNDTFIAAYGRRIESPQTWDWITSAAVASWALNLRLKRECYIRNAPYRLWLPMNFSYLEPMDTIMLPTGEVVRITQIEDDPNGRLAIEAEQWKYGTGNVTVYPKQGPTSFQPSISTALPGDTYVAIFEASPQSVLARPNTLQIAAAGNQPAWGGCQMFVSPDNSTYDPVGPIFGSGRVGVLYASLAATADPDTTDTLMVDMTVSGGELVTVTAAQWNAFATLAAIVDQSGTIELISFETATLTAANRYNLTNLRRGVYGTPILAHAIGAEFCYVGSQGVEEYQYPSQYANKTIYFKFASFNISGAQQQQLSACQAHAFTVPGYSLQPPSGGAFSTSPSRVLSSTASGSTASIAASNFTALLNNQSVACTPSAAATGLNQGQSYFVYYVDLAFQGGNITLIATQNLADFQGKSGYYQLQGPNADGSITTATTGSSVYRPGAYVDSGSQATVNPANAYDNNPTTAAGMPAHAAFGGSAYNCNIEYYTLPNVSPASVTLYVTAQTTAVAGPGSTLAAAITATYDGGATWHTLLSTPSTTALTTYSLVIPASTNLNLIQVVCTTSVTVPTSAGSASMSMSVADINCH